jgi:hypothetical protein
MATTTNYGWTTPDDTALVKDGAAAIRTLGSSVDTTTKNLNPETTLGDLAYRSSTANVKTRLALGTANQQLRVNSGATAPEWFTPAAASSGLTFINRTAISAAATTTIDSLFSDTYENYILDFTYKTSASGITPIFKFRYGATTHSANYNYGFEGPNDSGTPSNVINGSAVSAFTLPSSSAGSFSTCNFMITRFNGSERLYLNGQIVNPYNGPFYSGGMYNTYVEAWTGLEITTSSGTVTGTVSVYGLAKS